MKALRKSPESPKSAIKYCFADPEEKRGVDDELAVKFREIARVFPSEPNILPVSADHLEGSYRTGYAVLAYDVESGAAVGYTRLQHLFTGNHPLGIWLELGSTWVHPDFRHQGINEAMYNLLLPAHKKKNILATTTNEISLIVGRRLGLVQVPRKSLPEGVWRASCVCPAKKTGALDNAHCVLAHGEPQQSHGACWFRVTADTAERLGLS